jgi:hypothetical protein
MNENQIFVPELAAKARVFARKSVLSALFGAGLGLTYLLSSNFRIEPFLSYFRHSIAMDFAVGEKEKALTIKKIRADEKAIESFKNEIMLSALISVLSGSFAMLLLSQLLKKRSRKALEGEFIDGFREVTKLAAKREQRRKQADPATEYDYADSKGDIFFDGVRLPRYAGAGHALFMGASGSGKTQYINTAIEQIRMAGSKAIIVDPGGLGIEFILYSTNGPSHTISGAKKEWILLRFQVLLSKDAQEVRG